MIIAYCDGSCIKDNYGGWGAIIIENGVIIKKLFQGYTNTTNNRMELRGIIGVLKYFKTPTKLKIYSDSQYVVNSILNKHVYKWFQDQDYSKKNLDLWFELIDLLEFHDVEFEWVKGHDGNKYNELADRYATLAATCLNLPEDLHNDIQFTI